MPTDSGENSPKVGQLQEEIEELQQSLHNAQKREVSCNDLLSESHDKYNELKFAYDRMWGKRLAHE